MDAAWETRVLVCMPTAKDGERTRAALAAAGLTCTVCSDLPAFCRAIQAGAGVGLIAEELIIGDHQGQLAATLREQPPWSDFPLVILTRERAETPPVAYRESLNISLVERPVRIRSMLSVVRAALRSRRHQFEVRDHLAERERYTAELAEKEERLQFALVAGSLGAWDLDLKTLSLECSRLCKENCGRDPDRPFSYADLLATIHSDDRERVQAALMQAIEQRASYDVEYRTLWPDGTIHWLMVRGMAKYDVDGTPLRMTGVSLDVTERRRHEESLRETAQKKDEFLALLAHELRNPLAPLRNGLQVISLAQEAQVRQRAQTMMERQLGHMVRLIDDLLDVSRLNRNKMELRIERISLTSVVESAIETVRPAIEAAGHELRIDLPPERILLDADLTRLAQVFGNLLTNAAKYTEPGGTIELIVSHDGDQATVMVRDTGIGIPADCLTRIFDMFSQVDRSIERSAGGLGIGLALVKGLVEMHGGSVSAASAGPGKGSTFTVRLPLAGIPMEPTISAPPEANAQSGPGRRILVVDDNLDSAETMAQMLELIGHEVVTAHDGLAALQEAESFRPAVILMDVGMPRLNGLDATRRIREQPWGQGISIIALTGWGQEGDRERSRAAGCDGHLVKPVDLADLKRLLEESAAACGY